MELSSRKKNVLLALALTAPVAAFAQGPITAVLKLKERVSLETLAKNVQDPLSPRYGKYYTPDEIRDLAAPSPADYNSLIADLKSEGFQVTNESKTHLWLTVKADPSVFERAFNTRVEFLSDDLHYNISEPMQAQDNTLAASLVESVTGLDNTRKSHPRYYRANPLAPSAPTPVAPGGVPQATIKSAYGFNAIYQSGVSGKSQDIAIATYDGFYPADVQQFYQMSNLNPLPTVDQVQYNGTPTYNEDSAMETQLDAEFSGMIAPGASVHVFASATNDDAGELQMFTNILDDNRSKVVNYSWGDCEKNLTPQHQKDMSAVFERAIAQGVNIMVASGDSGSDACNDGTTAADWPAASPDVVAVGGTTFQGDATSPREAAWSGSGGGISAIWVLPTWQSSLGNPYVNRSYPDVSFNADPASGQAIWAHSSGVANWVVIGGTSMAAPQWSGFVALVNAAREAKGKTAIGFLNPLLYSLSAAEKTADFHDVISGNNGAYTAGAGWDAVTGWGSMQADALLNQLVNL